MLILITDTLVDMGAVLIIKMSFFLGILLAGIQIGYKMVERKL